jgi:hypothetical protein
MVNKKGQSAMEYLSTWGWVLVIIVIVAAALYGLGILSPSTFQQKTCTGFAQLGYSDHQYRASDDRYTIVLTNGAGKDITDLNNMTVTTSAGTASAGPTGVTLPWKAGEKRTLYIAGPAAGSVGSGYTATVSVSYDTADLAGKTETGTCTGKVE